MSLTAFLRCAEILDTIRAGLWYTHTEMENIPHYMASGGAFRSGYTMSGSQRLH
ncbi:hypothetical protein [Paenibacillus tundrae]|uniref:Uncharacterized protein n=1 Tax=Paenibacillus tundrae TaxID=528187 RepID=A0ABT9W7Z1_9BACL|nr:hypothetical protein [Paenibacillus tundrae]MDQ0169374.1 hypothetical protein [Paenibacillus tundrae]